MGECALPQQPKAHRRNPALLAVKRERLDEPHVARLGVLVREITDGRGRRGSVPFVDPDSGGDRSRVLMILESPGPMADAAGGSGFLSVDNDDETAANAWRTLCEVGLSRLDAMPWNVVPWYLGTAEQRVKKPTSADVGAGLVWIDRVIELMENLRVVLLLGAYARDAWPRTRSARRADLRVVRGIHPSPTVINRNRVVNLAALTDGFATAAAAAAKADLSIPPPVARAGPSPRA